jgi:hypothetical protein
MQWPTSLALRYHNRQHDGNRLRPVSRHYIGGPFFQILGSCPVGLSPMMDTTYNRRPSIKLMTADWLSTIHSGVRSML